MPSLIRKLGAGLAVGLILTACNSAPPEEPAKPKFGDWGYDSTAMDDDIAPGDDFYDYALGSWVNSAEIQPNRSCVGIDTDIQDQLEVDLDTIIEEAAAENAPAGDNAQLIGDLYQSFVDVDTLETLGLQPVQPYLDRIDATTDRAGVADTLVSFNKDVTSISDPFPVGLVIDPNDPTRYILTITQGGLSLDDRDYYLNEDPESVALRDEFVAHVERMLTLAGYDDAAEQAQQVLALETALAQVQWSSEQLRDVEATNNIMPRPEVEKLADGAPLGAMLDALGYPADIDVQVQQPDVLAKTAQLFAGEPVESWKAYQRYQVLNGYGGFLSQPISEELFNFYGRIVAGQEERNPRDVRGVNFVNGQLGEAVGERYVALRFPESTKADVKELVDNLRAAYAARIDSSDWMSPETKEQAQAKLEALVEKIGYPDEWESYDGLEIKADDLFGNIQRMALWGHHKDLDKLGKPIDRTEWGMTPQTNNAYYSARLNDIVFPAGILQPPYFDPAADPAANYGAIGATIGHEMSHAFDDQGRKTDSEGMLRDWWTPQDAERYQDKTDSLVAQFDSYQPLPGVHINGQLTLGENIADLAGLRVTYDAYKASLGGKEAPVIDGLTGDQRFFLAYAASWKNMCREEVERNRLLTDPHSPNKFRVNGIVRNMDEWYDAFDITEDSDLYLAPEERVRIW